MSIKSKNPKSRLFLHQSKFLFDNNDYFESLYYKIKNVEYNDSDVISKVEIDVIIDVQNYLDEKRHSVLSEVFEHKDIPQHVLNSANEYSTLVKKYGSTNPKP